MVLLVKPATRFVPLDANATAAPEALMSGGDASPLPTAPVGPSAREMSDVVFELRSRTCTSSRALLSLLKFVARVMNATRSALPLIAGLNDAPLATASGVPPREI